MLIPPESLTNLDVASSETKIHPIISHLQTIYDHSADLFYMSSFYYASNFGNEPLFQSAIYIPSYPPYFGSEPLSQSPRYTSPVILYPPYFGNEPLSQSPRYTSPVILYPLYFENEPLFQSPRYTSLREIDAIVYIPYFGNEPLHQSS